MRLRYEFEFDPKKYFSESADLHFNAIRKLMIHSALEINKGNVKQTAKDLKLDRSNLNRLIRILEINVDQFRLRSKWNGK